MDLARSIQDITEEVMLKMTAFAHRETGLRDLCLAGGVALNCVGNGRILREGPFEEIWIQPAAGDAGRRARRRARPVAPLSRQAARSPEAAGLAAATGRRRRVAAAPYADGMSGSFLGPRFGDEEIGGFLGGERLRRASLPARRRRVSPRCSRRRRSSAWFQGRMEFGPRALGGRSIIGDARSPKMQSVMNLKIKFRESFRPFAPAVLREHVADWFELDADSPYMLLVADVAPSASPRPLPPEAEPCGASRS